MWVKNNSKLQKTSNDNSNNKPPTAITKTAFTLLTSYDLNIKLSVSIHVFVFVCLEKEAEKVEEDLGSMVGSAHWPASQSRQVSMCLSSWVDLTELSYNAYLFRSVLELCSWLYPKCNNYTITTILMMWSAYCFCSRK